MIFQHADTTGLTLYVVIFNDEGNEVWDNEVGAFQTYYDEDDLSSSFDPFDMGVALTENPYRVGWYSADIPLDNQNGWIRYEVFEQLGTSPDSEDDRVAINSVYLKEGAEYVFEQLEDEIEDNQLSEQDRRRIVRAANRARTGRSPR